MLRHAVIVLMMSGVGLVMGGCADISDSFSALGVPLTAKNPEPFWEAYQQGLSDKACPGPIVIAKAAQEAGPGGGANQSGAQPAAPTPPLPAQGQAASPQAVVVSITSGSLSPCAVTVLKGAIDYCVRHALTANDWDVWLERLAQGGIVVAAVATGAASAAGLAGPALAGVGIGTLLLTNTSSGLQKILPTSPYSASLSAMTQAATDYAQMTPASSQMAAIQDYGRFWNAIGSACPPDLFKAVVPKGFTGMPTTASATKKAGT